MWFVFEVLSKVVEDNMFWVREKKIKINSGGLYVMGKENKK